MGMENKKHLNHLDDYKNIFNLSFDIMCKVDAEGNFKDVNPAFKAILEWDIDEVLHTPFTQFIHPEDIEYTTKEILKHFTGIGNDVIINRYKTKSGGYKHISWKGNVNKETGDFYGVGRDVSNIHQKLSEVELISKAVSKTKDAVVITNIAGEIIWVNKSFEKLTEYSLSEVIGKKPGSFLQGKNTNQDTVEAIRNAVKQRKEIDINILNYNKSNKEYWLNINISPIYNDQGEIENFIAIERDVTNQIKLDDEKRNSEKRWQIAIENSGYGLWDWNIQTDECYFSDAWKSMLGFAPNEVENKVHEWTIKVHPDDLEKAEEDVLKHLKGETEFYESTHRMKCKDGSFKWILDKGKIVEWDENGKPLKMIGTHHDLSVEIETKEKLTKQKDSLNEAQHLSKIGSWEFDVKTQTSTWSDEQFNIFEIEPSIEPRNLHKEYKSRVHPDEYDSLEKLVHKAIEEKSEFNFEYRIVLSNSKIKHVIERGKIILNEAGEIDKIIGVTQDITQQKLLELENQKVQADLKTAQHLSKIGSWEANIITQERTWSDELYAIYELDKEEDENKYEKLKSRVHPEDFDELIFHLNQCGEKGIPLDFEFRGIYDNGKSRRNGTDPRYDVVRVCYEYIQNNPDLKESEGMSR